MVFFGDNGYHRCLCFIFVLCLYQERSTTGIIFCHQTGGPITRWAIRGRAYFRDLRLCRYPKGYQNF